MGHGASVSEQINTELVDKESKLPPDHHAWFVGKFKAADKDKTGKLSYEAFWKIIEEMGLLNYSEAEVARFQEMADENHDGVIDYAEAVNIAPTFLDMIYGQQGIASSNEDWTEQMDNDGNVFYYNIKTGKSQWTINKNDEPQEQIPVTDDETQEHLEFEEEGLINYFLQYDLNCTGTLTYEEFWECVNHINHEMNLNMTDDAIIDLQIAADLDPEGIIDFNEYLPTITSLLGL